MAKVCLKTEKDEAEKRVLEGEKQVEDEYLMRSLS